MRAPLPDLDALDIEALKALILSQHEEKQRELTELAKLRQEHQAELAARSEQIEHLRLLVEKLRRMLFGRKSEKLSIQLDQLELQLEEMEAIHVALASVPVGDAQADTTGTKPARKPLPEHLPRQIVTHEPKESCCPECGGDLRHFGDDVSEQLDYVPESFRVIRHVRPKFACSKCETVVEAPAPSRPIARGVAAPGLLAHVLVSKYADHCPLYRQAEIYTRQGVDLDRSTLAGWVGASSELLAPLVDAVRRHVLGATKLHADDTPVPVLAPGNGKTKTGRLWTYVRDDRPAGDNTAPAVWFAYSPDRKGEHPRDHLKDFTGTLQADAYSGFHHLYDTGRIREAACWAHARRKFHDIHAAHPSPTTTDALDRIGVLYGIEAEVRGKPPDERRAIRQARAAPLLGELRAWMEKTLRSLSPKSETAEAIRYALSRWRALTRYVDDGHIEIDNSAAERALRAVALGRKNYLFCGSDGGGESAAAIYTLLGTARLNGVDPERWLREVLSQIADHPLNRWHAWLAWLRFCQATRRHSLNAPLNRDTIVRFFYLPPNSYFHAPLSFRMVARNDPRLGTAPFAKPYDRTPYISLPEMQNLISALAQLNLSWQESEKVETPKKIPTSEMTDKLQITVFSSGGTYRAFVDPSRLCETLAPLDAALKEPRARWEFQLFRVNYHCTVAGFSRDAYPEHDEPTR